MPQVTDYLHRQTITAGPDTLVSRAAELFEEHGIKHLPVCDEEGRVVGVFSAADLRSLQHQFTKFDTEESRKYNARIGDSFLLSDVMTENVKTVMPTTDLKEAAAIFLDNSFHSLCVVEPDDSGKLVGIITVMDLVRAAYQ
ncbi:MAG: CBS domain-containing protein [Saprospiraceae bacterium]